MEMPSRRQKKVSKFRSIERMKIQGSFDTRRVRCLLVAVLRSAESHCEGTMFSSVSFEAKCESHIRGQIGDPRMVSIHRELARRAVSLMALRAPKYDNRMRVANDQRWSR